jgi:hypothetical protein
MFPQIPQFRVIPFLQIILEVFVLPFRREDERCVSCGCFIREVEAIFGGTGTGVAEIFPEILQGLYH